MKPLLLGVLLSIGWQTAFAGKITLQGVSNLRHSVEFVTIRLDVRSRCALSPVESAEISDLAKNQLKDLIAAHLQQGDDSRDQIVESGSNTNIQDEYDNSRETLCDNGWTTAQSLTVKTLQLKKVSAIRIDLLQLIAKISENQPKTLVVSMGAPRPALLPETVAALETDAMKSALIDASKKLKAVQEICPMENVKIASISEGGAVIRDYADGDVPAGSLNFDQQYVHQSWNVTWSFKSTSPICQ